MLERGERSSLNKTLLAWFLTSSMSSLAYSLETEEPITVNKVRAPQSFVPFVKDNVRCFCNLPQCVSTGYMCLSSEGGCFSSFLDHAGHHSKDYRGRHGCLEFLNEESSALCASFSNDSTAKKKSLTFCCHDDMCNHVDSPETKDIINKTLPGEPSAAIGNLQQPIDYTNSQVWFRAATIAVPVCGAVILFVLIALAVKILRSENQNHATQKLGPSYEHHLPSQSKHGCDKLDNILRKSQHQKCLYHQYPDDDFQRIQVPLLKNETNAKLNGNVASVVLDIEKATKCSKSNLVQHVNNDKKYVNDEKHFINSLN